jgi:hypothetical protein
MLMGAPVQSAIEYFSLQLDHYHILSSVVFVGLSALNLRHGYYLNQNLAVFRRIINTIFGPRFIGKSLAAA